MSGHTCNWCNRTYREQFNFDRHFLCCQFLHRTRRQRNNEIDIENDPLPSQRDMYSLLQDLVLRVNTLEGENRRYKQLLTRKVNIIDWLNNNTPPPMIFSRWLSDIVFPFVKDNLNIVFQNDLLKGIMATLDSALASMDTDQIPLRAFSGRNTAFYIFDHNKQEAEPPRWYKLTSQEFDKYLAKIDHQFLVDFNRYWYCAFKERMEVDESYKDKYITYHKAILGGNRVSDEARYNKIRHLLFERIKRRISAVTEIDSD